MAAVFVFMLGVWLGLEVYFAYTSEPAPDVDHGRRLMDLAAQWQGGEDADDAWFAVVDLAERWNRLPAGYANEAEWAATHGNAWIFRFLVEDANDPAKAAERTIPKGMTPEEARVSLDMNRETARRALGAWEETGLDGPLDTLVGARRVIRPLADTTQHPILQQELSDLPNVRSVAFALRVLMIQSRDAGDWDAYTHRFEQILALGRVYRWQVSFIEQSVGSAVRKQAFEQARLDLVGGKLPAEHAPRLVAAMDRQARAPGLGFAVESSRSESLIYSQWLHTSRGRIIISDVDSFMGNGGPVPKAYNMLSVFYARRSETDAWINAYYDELRRWYEASPYERRGIIWRMKFPESYYDDDASPVAKVRSWAIPALGRIMASYEQADLEELGLRTQIAIESFRLRSGGLPETLGDLIPSDLAEPPVDPLANGRAALGYIRLASPDEYGRVYILYSVGGDGEDNQGKPGYEGATLYGNNLDGTDFILNSAR